MNTIGQACWQVVFDALCVNYKQLDASEIQLSISVYFYVAFLLVNYVSLDQCDDFRFFCNNFAR